MAKPEKSENKAGEKKTGEKVGGKAVEKEPSMQGCATRLLAADVQRLRRLVDEYERRNGVRPKTSTFVRTLIQEGLENWEKKYKLKSKR